MSATKIVVLHAHYGCDTGCCGHVVLLVNKDAEVDEFMRQGDDGVLRGEFVFDHARDDQEEAQLAFAKELVRQEFGEEHVADLVWEDCIIDPYWCGS